MCLHSPLSTLYQSIHQLSSLSDMVAEAFPLLYGRFPNYYELLGISQNASTRDVSLAYKKTALREHPDKAGSTPAQNELFAAINNAKSVLTDNAVRKTYDFKLGQHLRPAPRPQPAKPLTKHPPPGPSTRSGGNSHTDPSRPFETSSNRTGFSWNSNFKPFGAGSGFGPERSAPDPGASTDARGAASTDYNRKRFEPETHTTGCPICGSQFCPGSRYSGQRINPEIPCYRRANGSPFFQTHGPGANTPKSTFGTRSSSAPADYESGGSPPDSIFGRYAPANEKSSGRCTGDPDRCPKHYLAYSRERATWKEPFALAGDPNYVDPNRTVPFQNFIPPTSAYGRDGHNGTMPSSPAWFEAHWRCLSLSVEHQLTISVAMKICDVAIFIERSIDILMQHCVQQDTGPCHRLAATFDLLKELMHFAAASYRYSGTLIDLTIYNEPEVAAPRLVTIRNDLTTVLNVTRRTRFILNGLIALIVRPHVDIGAWMLVECLRSIFVAWDQVVMLPDNITRGAQDVFFSRVGRLENTFERVSKSAVAPYPMKPFMYREPTKQARETDPGCFGWNTHDEQPTLRRWETGQRTYEALQNKEAETMQATAYGQGWGSWFNSEGDGVSVPGADVNMSG